jgi:hypothetical protein
MAKANATPQVEDSAAPVQASAPALDLLTFRDKVYTSRTLITPKTHRPLSVAKSEIQVSQSDTEAVAFLKDSEEFEPLKE